MIKEVIKQLKEYTERLEDMKRLEDEDRNVNEEYYEIVSRNGLRELSYKVGSFFEGRKPMKESHKQLRKEMEVKVRDIVKTIPLSEYMVGISISFVSAPPVNFEGPDWESDAITNVLEIRVAMECGIDPVLLQQFKSAFKVNNDGICVAGHQYGKMPESVFNNSWIGDIRIVMKRADFEAL